MLMKPQAGWAARRRSPNTPDLVAAAGILGLLRTTSVSWSWHFLLLSDSATLLLLHEDSQVGVGGQAHDHPDHGHGHDHHHGTAAAAAAVVDKGGARTESTPGSTHLHRRPQMLAEL